MSNLLKKDDLIAYFLEIGGNDQTEKLKNCKSQCELFLLSEDDDDIRDLFNVVNAVMIYFETGDKKLAKEWVINLWYKLYPKKDFSFFDIRILSAIIFTETNIEKIIEIIEDCLIQLEIYRFRDGYVKTKIALNLNLLDNLMSSRFFDSGYKVEFDELISQTIEEIISLNLENRLNSAYYVGLANAYKGVFLKDSNLIYTGILLLKKSQNKGSDSIQSFIELYMEKYNIVI